MAICHVLLIDKYVWLPIICGINKYLNCYCDENAWHIFNLYFVEFSILVFFLAFWSTTKTLTFNIFFLAFHVFSFSHFSQLTKILWYRGFFLHCFKFVTSLIGHLSCLYNNYCLIGSVHDGYTGTAHFKKCKQLFEYQHHRPDQHLLLLRAIWWTKF
jgi:hypothetical protein